MLSLHSQKFKYLSIFLFFVFTLCISLHHLKIEYNMKTGFLTTEEITCSSVVSTSDFCTTTLENQLSRTSENLEIIENNVQFKNAVFYCINDDKTLYKYDAEERIAPASLTKILTACVAYYYIESSKKFTVGTELNLIKPHSSLCLINKGHILTLKDLVIGLLVASGNDAAYTIAVNTSKTLTGNKNMSDTQAVSFFVELMNSFASNIGMRNSHFTNPDGWDDDNQYTTVDDLLILSKYFLSIDELSEIVSLKNKYVVFASGQNITWENSNQLLNSNSNYYNKYAVGMKTGTTEKAGNCLIAVFNKNDKKYIGIVCGCATTNDRYASMNNLFKRYVK